MVTNIQAGKIYNRLTTNLRTGEKVNLVCQVRRLIQAEDGCIESIMIRDAISDADSQIPFQTALLEFAPIQLTRILLFALGFEKVDTAIIGTNVTSHYDLPILANNIPYTIVLFEEDGVFGLIDYDSRSNTYHVKWNDISLDELQEYAYRQHRINYQPDVKLINHVLLCYNDYIQGALLIKDYIENTGPLLQRGVSNQLIWSGFNSSQLEIDIIIKYGISCNYFEIDLSSGELLYVAP